jgi:hypothetical protein
MVTAYFIGRRRSDAQTNRGKQENRGPFDAGDGIKVRASFLFGVNSASNEPQPRMLGMASEYARDSNDE